MAFPASTLAMVFSPSGARIILLKCQITALLCSPLPSGSLVPERKNGVLTMASYHMLYALAPSRLPLVPYCPDIPTVLVRATPATPGMVLPQKLCTALWNTLLSNTHTARSFATHVYSNIPLSTSSTLTARFKIANHSHDPFCLFLSLLCVYRFPTPYTFC